jgi:hypothetical protein
MQTTVQTEFGPTAQVADWSQLQAYTGQIAAFCDSIGLANGQGAWVLRNGNSFYSSERHYFVERHNGTVPSGWLVHDTIDNNTLDLGSWWNSRRILAYVPDVSGWLYMQWPYAWSVEANSWLYFLVSGGDLWAYNFATGQWTRMQ